MGSRGLNGLRYWYLRRVVATALGTMGYRAASAVGALLGRMRWELEEAGSARGTEALRLALGERAAGDAGERILRTSYEHWGRFWVEVLFARRRGGGTIELEGENWATVRAARGPVIFVTGALGNPVVGAMAVGRLFGPLHFMIAEPADVGLRRWTHDLLAGPGLRLVGRQQALRRLPHVLGAGGRVMLMGDTERPVRHGGGGRARRDEGVEFLGRRRRVYATAEVLARRHGAAVVVVGCVRRGGDFRFALRAAEIIAPDAGDITQRCLAALETMIVEYAEQYMWSADGAAFEMPVGAGEPGV
jgi:lauroyl/myristoyl acyltransferase